MYDYLALARARVFGWVRPLSPEQYTRGFPIGAGSLDRILHHTLICEWYYVLRATEREVPPIGEIVGREEHPPPFGELERQWAGQEAVTREAIGAIRDWDAEIAYHATDDQTGKVRRVVTTPADIFTQLVLHEVHHRAQVLNILRQLGVRTEDIDYNTFMYRITDA